MVNEDAADRLNRMQDIIDQLIQEAQVLKTENMRMREAKGDFWHAEGERQDHGHVDGQESAARLRREVDMLRRTLRKRDDESRRARQEISYMDVCKEPSELGRDAGLAGSGQ